MSRKQKKMLVRIIIAAVMLIALKFIPVWGLVQLGLYLVAYLVIGYDILRKAGKGIANRRVFDENFLMAVATVGAFALALYEKSGDYSEAIAVMLFYQVGELVPELRGRQEPSEYHGADGYPPGLRECGAGRPADPGGPGGGRHRQCDRGAAGRKGPAGWHRAGGRIQPEHQRPDRREPAPGRPRRG